MNSEILKQTKLLFSQVGNFYAKWNAEPEQILGDLCEHPSIKRRIDANQLNRNKAFATQSEQFLSDLFAPRVYQPNVKRLRVIATPVIPDSYRLSERDILDCLYHRLIIPLRDEVFTAFVDELYAVDNEVQRQSREQWCKDFDALLTAIEQGLIMSIANQKEWGEPLGDEDWPDIDQTLRTLAEKDIRPLIEKYEGVIKPYLPKQSPSADEKGLTQRQQILKHFYEGGMMVERKHPKYNDYNKYCTSNKRLAYPDESESKLKHLIKDIEKIALCLSGKAKQNAESELNTLTFRLTAKN